MSDLVKRLIAESDKKPWNRNLNILTEAAIELAKLEDEKNYNIIIHIKEMNKLLNPWISIKETFPPKHTEILLYREDAGSMFGQYTYCGEWITEQEAIENDFSEELLFEEDFWAYCIDGIARLEGDEIPTHWMPLPKQPKN